ncbi:MAG: 4Fe-4S dicluster domain-containing protein [Desulfotignum sp.]|nr:4Fe-4S dicluster domain-containing protein [Desulfotignum sp.]MCF8087778.1 4Fe-4S dicluster domain-containing protein [Desulfotignum sp.]MCF8137006.1 4Fe-4S dicluster domain-containing protein [Desulfotignum sp.]
MIKRSFFALSKPGLTCDLLEPDPEAPQKIDVPALLTLLLPEPLDGSRDALIQKGDTVKKGQKLQLYEDSIDYAVSPVSGAIKSIDTFTADDFRGLRTRIAIEKDTQAADGIEYPEMKQEVSFAAGHMNHLPGAPPFGRLARTEVPVNTLIIMVSDTDLLSTTSQYMGTTHAATLQKGVQILKQITKVPKIYLVLPDMLQDRVRFDGLTLLPVDLEYPEALPAMIMKNHLDKILPAGTTPEEMGICFIQAEAVVSLARAFETNAPVFEKCITLIDKTGARHRVEAVIGTPLGQIFSQLGIQINEMDRIVIGGPMQGFATFTLHHPVTPDMDTILVQDRQFITPLSDNNCVNCGKCIQVCPADIPVNLLVRFLQAGQYEAAADKCDLEACIDCGLCAYVCTSHIALSQYIRLGKHELQKLRADV